MTAHARQRWNCHVEVTTRLHPNVNDSVEQIQALVGWVRDTLGPNTAWHVLPGDAGAAAQCLKALLSGYEQFHEFERSELALIEALRTLRLLHYSAWIGRRWDDPAFPSAFPWFGTQRYWQDRILELREQIAAMDEEPLSV